MGSARMLSVLAAIGAALSATPAAVAQALRVGGLTLTPVEQGRADVGPLSATLRQTPMDLRLPQSFDRVYRVDASPRLLAGRQASPGAFARVSGGLFAIFPRSQYRETAAGLFAEIPAGTIFSIGEPSAELLGGGATTEPLRPSGDRQNLSAQPLSAGGATPALSAHTPGAALPPRPPTIFESEQARARRVAELMAQAARARGRD